MPFASYYKQQKCKSLVRKQGEDRVNKIRLAIVACRFRLKANGKLCIQKTSMSKHPKIILNIRFKIVSYLLLVVGICALQSCDKTEEDFAVEDKASFEAEINGEKITLIESGYYTNIENIIFWNPSRQRSYVVSDYIIETWNLDLGKAIMPEKPSTNNLSVQFVSHFEHGQYDENENITREQFDEVLREGEKEYTENTKDFPGINIRWLDADGELWLSGEPYTHEDSKPNEVENKENYFTINYSKFLDERSNESTFYQYLDISFQCRLYNWQGESILMKNAKLKYTYSIFQIP